MKWHREPLFHFLALGAGLFLLFSVVGDSEESRADRIVVTAGQIEQLAEGWARTWQRPPTPQELAGLVEDHIREEIYYREALAMGLDRDDTIVRRRMRQKLEFFTDDVVDAVDPSEDQLREYFAQNAERFRVPPRVSFDHVYFNRDRRGDAALRDGERLLSQLRHASAGLDPTQLGDPIMLPKRYQLASTEEIAGRFGRGFADAVTELPVGEWAGPVESGYGLHLVKIRERREGEIRAFEDIRQAVEREWSAARRAEAMEPFYQGLRHRYSIVVERPEIAGGEEGTVEVAEARP